MRISEIRQDGPEVKYTAVPKKKSEPDVIDSVVALVSGKTSEKFTKLARRYARAKRIAEMLKKEQDQLNTQTKAAVEELFDAADEVYTRVVETASLVFKMSKAGTSKSSEFDEAGFFAEIEKLTGMAVADLEELKTAYIKVIDKAVPSKLLTPQEKKMKSVNEGISDKLQNWIRRLVGNIKQRLDIWDRRFNHLKRKVS